MKQNDVALTVKKLKEIRVILDLTQEELAFLIKKSVCTVQSIECGRLKISQKFETEIKLFLERNNRDDLIEKYLIK